MSTRRCRFATLRPVFYVLPPGGPKEMFHRKSNAKMFHVKHLRKNFAGNDFIVDSAAMVRSVHAAPRVSADRRRRDR